jgi:hypothetical protein
MKSRLLFLNMVAVTLVAACGTNVTPTPTLAPLVDLHVADHEPFDLRLTNSALLFADDQPYRLDFTSVLADSRCPVGAECLRPDAAIFDITLSDLGADGGTESYQLFFDSGPSEGIVGPFTVQILAITPDVEEVHSPSDYVVTLVVSTTPVEASIDVHMASSASTVVSGDRVTYTASATGLARAQYTLSVDGVIVGITRHDGTLTRNSQTPVIELIDWSADATNASWTIEVRSPGAFVMEASIIGKDGGEEGSGSATGSGSAALTVTAE